MDMDEFMKLLGFIGNRWMIYLGFVVMGLFGVCKPAAASGLLFFFMLAVGVAGLIHAYNEGAFDKQIEELKEKFGA